GFAEEAHRVDRNLRIGGSERLLTVRRGDVRVGGAASAANVRTSRLVVHDVTLEDERTEVATNGSRGHSELHSEGGGGDRASRHDEAEHAIFRGVCGHRSSPLN